MLHVFIGTKAQYVKMAPVLLELDRRKVDYNLIDSGQHSALAVTYRQFFNIKTPDCFLTPPTADITTISGMLRWSGKILFDIAFKPKQVYRDIFKEQAGLCLIHGDTPTTLLSALAAKRVGIKVVHLESGLRSYNMLHPFPEELIRIITMRLADYLFAPSQWAFDNLAKMKLTDKSFLVCGNTNIDSLKFVAREELNVEIERNAETCLATAKKPVLAEEYVVFSIHRVETLVNNSRLKAVVGLAMSVAKSQQVLFCLHPPTKQKLQQTGYYNVLAGTDNILLTDLLPYPTFIQSLKQSQFVVTDGGSIQEECFFLNIPCLLMRHATERKEGLGTNVCLSQFEAQKIDHFLSHYRQYRNPVDFTTAPSPSNHIVDIILGKL